MKGRIIRKAGTKRKMSIMEYDGFYMVYPGQPMLEKRHLDKSKTQVFWGDICPDNSHKKGKWKITIEFEQK